MNHQFLFHKWFIKKFLSQRCPVSVRSNFSHLQKCHHHMRVILGKLIKLNNIRSNFFKKNRIIPKKNCRFKYHRYRRKLLFHFFQAINFHSIKKIVVTRRSVALKKILRQKFSFFKSHLKIICSFYATDFRIGKLSTLQGDSQSRAIACRSC